MISGKEFRELREKHGLTLKDVAKILNISEQAVNKYELEIVRNIPLDRIEKMASLYHVSPAYIMGWDEQPVKYAMSASPGDIKRDEIGTLIDIAIGLNDEGMEKLVEYAQDLDASGRYKK